MRNIFDQYTQPENRLTHALASALDEDPALMRRFVKWVLGVNPPKQLRIVEQQLPGEYELAETEYEPAGLPDAWIHNDDEWSLLIECKVKATLSLDQLKRHYRTAEKRGFEDVTVLAIDVAIPKKKLPDYVVFRTWREVYSWLSHQSKNSEWATRVLRYMEVAERKWSAEGYLKEGTLTEFAGIPFDQENPYNYGEAKRLVRLLMEELREHSSLKDLIDPKAAGRGAIKGRHGTSVWDFLRLRHLDQDVHFNKQPHLTLSISEHHVSPVVILPNSMETVFRRKLESLGEKGFFELMAAVEKNTRKVCRSANGAKPWVLTTQRHHLSRNAPATIDGDINFDLRTAFDLKKSPTKYQPQWLAASYDLLINKNSNLGFSVGVKMPYDSCSKLKKPDILESIVASWIACSPLLDFLLE